MCPVTAGLKLEPMPRPQRPAQSITLAGVSLHGAELLPGSRGLLLRRGRHAQPAARDKTLAERWSGSHWQLFASLLARVDQDAS